MAKSETGQGVQQARATEGDQGCGQDGHVCELLRRDEPAVPGSHVGAEALAVSGATIGDAEMLKVLVGMRFKADERAAKRLAVAALSGDAPDLRALTSLADRYRRGGKWREAERLAAIAASAADTAVLHALAESSRTADTERLYRLAVDTGDVHTMSRLASLRSQAKQLARTSADAGDTSARVELAGEGEREAVLVRLGLDADELPRAFW